MAKWRPRANGHNIRWIRTAWLGGMVWYRICRLCLDFILAKEQRHAKLDVLFLRLYSSTTIASFFEGRGAGRHVRTQ